MMQASILMGAETEYGFSLVAAPGGPIAAQDASFALVQLARERLRHLPDAGGQGAFLENGSRLYADCGHVELATPEVLSPQDLVRYQIAGDLIVAELAQELGRQHRAEPVLFKACVDYYNRTTFGAHESYGFRGDRSLLPPQILPFLASRPVLAGAGGFSNLSPGLEFTLSPRVTHLVRETGEASTNDRALYNTREEPLCKEPGYHRIHLLQGENLCSAAASLYRFGATALVIKMVEAGVSSGAGVTLKSPLAALKRFAADPSLKAAAPLCSGRQVTALDIQRHYLQEVSQRLGEPWMPSWAPGICALWADLIDRLERSPEELGLCLDWNLKRRLYTDHLRRRGFTWEQVEEWNRRMPALSTPAGRTPAASTVEEAALPERRASPAARERRTSAAPAPDPSPSELDRFLSVRAELFELDVRFSQLGERGVFAQLSSSGVLPDNPLAPSPASIRDAMVVPPDGTRASMRGRMVRLLSPEKNRYVCQWEGIWDSLGRRFLDVSQSLVDVDAENWNLAAAPPEDPTSGGLQEQFRALFSRLPRAR